MAILTISRQFGSGGREVGQFVARDLNYEYIDKDKIIADLGTSGKKWEEWGANLDEHCPTIWEKYDWSFRGFSALIQSHILDYALKDRVVIMGRGGNFLLKDVPYAFRVRVVAPVGVRIKRIMEREKIDIDTAKWLAEKTDKERSSFIHSLYGKHWDDTKSYDMVFDNGNLTTDEITDIIKTSLLGRERLNTDESRGVLRMHALAARIKADIFTNPEFFIPVMDVYYNGKELVLKGIIHNAKEHKRIEDAARHLAGDVPLRCELHYRG